MWGGFDKALPKRLRNWKQCESLQMTEIFNSSGCSFWHKNEPEVGLNAMRSMRAPLLTAVATRRLLQLDLRPGSCQGSGSEPCPLEPSPPRPKSEPFNPPPHSLANTFPRSLPCTQPHFSERRTRLFEFQLSDFLAGLAATAVAAGAQSRTQRPLKLNLTSTCRL